MRLDVRPEHESIWLTQKQMAELFGRDQSVISRHIHRALAGDEPVILYSLDAVISVGYRVTSARGTQFRIWATRTLREHLLRGYTLNDAVLDFAVGKVAVEAKSGVTVPADAFRGLDMYCPLSDARGVLVYGGDESYERRGHVVRAWWALT